MHQNSEGLHYANRINKTLWLAPFLHLLDCLSTFFAMSLGGKEGNPYALLFMKTLGFLWGLAAFALIFFIILSVSIWAVIRGKEIFQHRQSENLLIRILGMLCFLGIIVLYIASAHKFRIIFSNLTFALVLNVSQRNLRDLTVFIISFLTMLWYTRSELTRFFQPKL